MGMTSVLGYAQKLVEERVNSGDIVVDATVGNGVDTLFLARLAGPRGRVYGFDIQERALANTRERLARQTAAIADVTLLCRSHAELGSAVPQQLHGKIAAVMFNLGYLPGHDPAVKTAAASTLAALKAAIALLRPHGIATAVVYPGHEGGEEEADGVRRWAEQLPWAKYQALNYCFLNRDGQAAFLIAVVKK